MLGGLAPWQQRALDCADVLLYVFTWQTVAQPAQSLRNRHSACSAAVHSPCLPFQVRWCYLRVFVASIHVNLITKIGNEATLSVLEIGVGGTVKDGKLWAPLVRSTSASLEEFCLRCVPGEMAPAVLQDVGKYCDEQARGIIIY